MRSIQLLEEWDGKEGHRKKLAFILSAVERVGWGWGGEVPDLHEDCL